MRTRAVSLALLAAALLAGCGGSGSSGNGIAGKPVDQILTAATKAAQSAGSVRVSGDMAIDGQPGSLDLNLVSGKGASGTMSASGTSFDIIDVGSTLYLRGSDSFWQRVGGQSAAQLFHGKWLKAPATSGDFSVFAQFADLNTLFSAMLGSHGALTKGKTTTINGQPVVGLVDRSHSSTLYVATTGKPYPIQLAKSGTGGGHVDFTNWNKPVTLTAPANSVDVSKLKRG